jgi:hypothetical protein
MFSARGGFEYAYSSGVTPASYVTTITATRGYSTATTSDGQTTYVTGTSSTSTPLLKLNAAGNIIAQTTLVGTDQARSVFLDSSNNVYLTGIFSGDGNDGYVVKYDSNLSIQWQRSYSSGAGTSDYWINGVTDSGGNVFLGGTGDNNATFAMYNSSGTLQWQKQVSICSITEGVACDTAGNFYTLMSEDLTASTDAIRLAKWNSSGTNLWVRRLVGASDPSSYTTTKGVVTDSSNNVFAFTVVSSVLHLVKYNSSGTLQWKIQASMSIPSGGLPGLATDNSGNLYISCYLASPVSYWVAKIDSTGAFVWQRQITSTNTLSTPMGRMYWSDGYVYLSGAITTPNNMLLAKLPDDGSLTGTHGAYTYASTSYTLSTSSITTSTVTADDSTASYTSATSSFTSSTPTYTQTITLF